MASIIELRAQRTKLIEGIRHKEAEVKSMDADMRTIRGDISRMKNKERELTREITKLAKDEL